MVISTKFMLSMQVLKQIEGKHTLCIQLIAFDVRQPVPGSEIVGPAELRKSEEESKTGGNWGEKGRRLSLPSFFLFPAPPTFRVPFSFTSSPLSESLEQARLQENATQNHIILAFLWYSRVTFCGTHFVVRLHFAPS